jgi:hypothetical protein
VTIVRTDVSGERIASIKMVEKNLRAIRTSIPEVVILQNKCTFLPLGVPSCNVVGSYFRFERNLVFVSLPAHRKGSNNRTDSTLSVFKIQNILFSPTPREHVESHE